MRTYDMRRARALMGLGELTRAMHGQLVEARVRIFENINSATQALLDSQVSEQDSPEVFARASVLNQDLEALYTMIDMGKVEDSADIASRAQSLEARSESLLREARALAAANARGFEKSYALALGFGITAAIVGGLWITAKAGR